MSRRKARELALQTLFQLDFNHIEMDVALAGVAEEFGAISEKSRSYATNLVMGTKEHLAEIDAIIEERSEEWSVARMPGVDRNIARMAVFELAFSKEDIPQNVVVNEAVELAKTFGTDASSRFINGVLGALIKNKVQ
ncbi:MAG: NusB antitermination factor [Firmicutes bacterium]|nr:NusB antitermination factor [Bacillota bacterium]